MPKVDSLTDNFDDNSIDNTKWTTGSSGSGSSIAETNGQLVVTLPSNVTGFSFVDSNTLDLTNSSAIVECPTRPNATNGTEQALQLRLNASNYVGFKLQPNSIEMAYSVGGTPNSTFITRDDRLQHWFKIRESGGTVYWETSPDRTNWTIQRSEAAAFDLSTVKVRLHGGCWQAVASPGTAAFDNFNLESPTFRNTAEGQPNSTTLTAANSGGGSGDAFSVYSTQGTISTTYSTDISMFGTQSYKVVANASSAVYIVSNTSGAYCGSSQMYLYIPAYPSPNQLFLLIYNTANSPTARFTINGNGAVLIGNVSGTIHTSSAGTIPLNQWVRLDFAVQVGATTSNGRIVGQVSLQNSFTPLWSYDSGYSTNTGTDPLMSYQRGKLDSAPNIPLFYMDHIAWRNNMIDFIPPESSSPGVGWFTA